MHSLIRDIQKDQLKKVPQIRTGYTVAVHQKIKEGSKERVQIFEGLVIKVGHGEGVEKTFTVRKIVEGIGVEKVFPIHSPNLVKVVIKKKAKIRRSKLYYMRERSGKSARLKERHVTDQERAEEAARVEAEMQKIMGTPAVEEVKAEAPVEAVEAAPAAEEVKAEVPTPEAPVAEAPVAEEKAEDKKEESAN